MAVRNIIGFETGDASEANGAAVSGTASIQSSLARTGTYALRTNPATSGAGSFRVVGLGANAKTAPLGLTESYIGFAFRAATLPASGEEPMFLSFATGGANGVAAQGLRITSGGVLKLYNGEVFTAGTLLATGSTALTTGVWYYIEIWLGHGDGAATDNYELRIDGAVEFSGTAQFGGAGQTRSSFDLGKQFNVSSQSVDFYYDDVYVADDGFLGPINVKVALPTGNSAANTGWTVGAGQKYEAIDEIPPTNTEEITSGTGAGDKRYSATHPSAATLGVSSDIVAVKVVARMSEVTSTTTLGAIGIRSGSTNYETTNVDIGNTADVTMSVVHTVDPNTAAAWTQSGFNAAEPIVKRSTSDTSNIACSALYLMVAYRPLRVTPATAELEIEGFAPNLSLQVTPATEDLEVEGFAPSVVVGKVFTPDSAAVEVQGFEPGLTLQVTPAAGELEVEGFAPEVGVGKLVEPTAAEMAVEGFAPELIVGRQHHSLGVRLNVFEPDGVTPAGIVTHVLTASYGQDVNAIGSWSVTIPADSPQAAYLGDRYRVQIYIGGEGYTFQGIVTKRMTRVTGETKVLEVSGWSTARELVDRDTGQGFQLENQTLDAAFTSILDVEGTWATGTVGSPSLAVWSRRFDGVKLWQGLVKLADMFGVLFREDSRTRTIDAGTFGDDSGLTFKNWEGPVPADLHLTNPDLVLLNGIDVAIETQDIVTRVEPFAQRQGITGDKGTLEHATDTTLYTTQTGTRNSLDYYYLVDSAAEALYGRIEASIIVSDVLPLGLDPATDLVRAANALHGVAATWLSRRVVPLRSYQIRPEGLRHIVDGSDTFKVGQKARVTYQGASKTADGQTVWLDLDEDLFIMGYRRTVTADGRSSWQMRVSNVTREVPDSTTKLAEMYEQFEASLTAPWPMITWGGTPPVGRLTPDGGQLAGPKTDVFQGQVPNRSWSWFRTDFDGDKIGDIAGLWDDALGFETHAMYMRARKAADGGSAVVGVWNSDDPEDYDAMFQALYEHVGDVFLWRTATAPLGVAALEKLDANNWKLKVLRGGSLAEVGNMKATGQGPYEISKASVGSSYAGVSNVDELQGSVSTFSAAQGSGTVHAIPMPGGGGAGAYVMVVAARAAISTPAGWSVLTSETNTPVNLAVYYLDGSPGATVDVTIGSSVCIAAHVYRLPDNVAVTTASGTDASSDDPPSHSVVSGEGARTLWIVASATNAGTTVSAWPSTWPTGTVTNPGGTNPATLASTVEFRDSFTENPGAFTWSSSSNPCASTCGVPVAGLKASAVLTAITANQSGLITIGTGLSGAEETRGTIRIPAADARAELVTPILISANEPLWVKKDGSTGTVRLEFVNEEDLG